MGDYSAASSGAADGVSAASTAADAGSYATTASDAAGYAGTTGGDALSYADQTTAYPVADTSWYDSIKSGLDQYQKGKEGGFGDFIGRFGEKDNYGFNMENAGYIGGKMEGLTKMGGGGGGSAPTSQMNVTNNMMQPNNDRYAQLYRLYSGRP